MPKKLRQEQKEHEEDALEQRSSLQGKEHDDQGGHHGLGLILGEKLLG